MTFSKKNPKEAAAAGRKGGKATMEKHGPDHFSRIGEKGGTSLLKQRGSRFFQEIGRLSAKKQRAAESGELAQVVTQLVKLDQDERERAAGRKAARDGR